MTHAHFEAAVEAYVQAARKGSPKPSAMDIVDSCIDHDLEPTRWHRAVARIVEEGKRRENGQTAVCAECGKMLPKATRKFCSKPCHYASMKGQGNSREEAA